MLIEIRKKSYDPQNSLKLRMRGCIILVEALFSDISQLVYSTVINTEENNSEQNSWNAHCEYSLFQREHY